MPIDILVRLIGTRTLFHRNTRMFLPNHCFWHTSAQIGMINCVFFLGVGSMQTYYPIISLYFQTIQSAPKQHTHNRLTKKSICNLFALYISSSLNINGINMNVNANKGQFLDQLNWPNRLISALNILACSFECATRLCGGNQGQIWQSPEAIS